MLEGRSHTFGIRYAPFSRLTLVAAIPYQTREMKIVEVDGFGSHSTPDQQEHDLERHNALLELGYEIRRFSARDVRRNPGKVINEITRFVSNHSVRVKYG